MCRVQGRRVQQTFFSHSKYVSIRSKDVLLPFTRRFAPESQMRVAVTQGRYSDTLNHTPRIEPSRCEASRLGDFGCMVQGIKVDD